MLPCVCSVIDHRRFQNLVKNKEVAQDTLRMCHRMTYTYVLGPKWYFLSGSSFLYILLVYSYFEMFFNAPTCSTSRIIANCESLVSGDTLLTAVVKISCSLCILISCQELLLSLVVSVGGGRWGFHLLTPKYVSNKHFRNRTLC